MRRLLLLLLSTGLSFSAYSQQYDAALAKRLHADEYGMKQYVMAILNDGDRSRYSKDTVSAILSRHLQNIRRLAADGKLVLAGPFMDDSPMAGIFIINEADTAKARILVNTDPAIKAGIFTIELHPWYGSAAIQEVLKIHDRIKKKDP